MLGAAAEWAVPLWALRRDARVRLRRQGCGWCEEFEVAHLIASQRWRWQPRAGDRGDRGARRAHAPRRAPV